MHSFLKRKYIIGKSILTKTFLHPVPTGLVDFDIQDSYRDAVPLGLFIYFIEKYPNKNWDRLRVSLLARLSVMVNYERLSVMANF